jgi:pimeloyl-ACP methyl ester carboxylesterase
MAPLTTYDHDGLTFAVDDSGGDGEVVVLLHGFPQTKACWHAVTPQLVAAGHRVLAPTQRGYSPGARPSRRRDYAMRLLVDDVLALADAAGAGRIHVVGHDWGGAVGWSLGADHPDRLASLTVLTTPHPAAMQRAMLTSSQALKSSYMVFFQLPRVPEALFRSERGGRLVLDAFERSGLSADDARRHLGELREGALPYALNWYRAIPFGARSAPGAVEVPTLYVYATGDVALGRKAADLTAEHVAGPYRYEVLEGASHWLPEEEPDRVAALVLEHVAAHPA